MQTLCFLRHRNHHVHCIRQIVHCFRLKTALLFIYWKFSCVRGERRALLQTDKCTASDQNRTASSRLKIIVCTHVSLWIENRTASDGQVHCMFLPDVNFLWWRMSIFSDEEVKWRASALHVFAGCRFSLMKKWSALHIDFFMLNIFLGECFSLTCFWDCSREPSELQNTLDQSALF